jgi:tetratricopeptide (TPR) repeat protein
MNISEAINTYGISVVLKSLFPHLKGIDFNTVNHNSDFDKSGFFSTIDGKDWCFSVGSMPLLFRYLKPEVISTEINKLLIINNINLDSSYNDSSGNITLWDGDGFKIEKVTDNNSSLVIITSLNSITKATIAFNETSLAKTTTSPNWISGLAPIYGSKSIDKNERDFSKFILCPLLFERDNEYILIPVQADEFAKPIIDKIIDDNGGYKEFNEENHDGWLNLYSGHLFVIGYLPKHKCVRINRKQITASSTDGESLASGIHPLSNQVNSIVKGLNKQIYNPADGAVADGRMVASSEKANNIVAFDENASNLISSFKDVVVQYNTEDPFLKIKSSSINTWMDKNPEETITFSVPNNFELILSIGNAMYRLNLFPPGGLIGSWPKDIPQNDFEELPEVNFSKEILTRQTPPAIKNTNTINKSASNITDDNQKRAGFIESSVVDNEDLNVNTSKSSKSASFLKWLFIIIGVILLFFLLRNCSASRDAEYYYKRGLVNAESGKFDKASRDYENAINLDNDYIDPYLARGEMNLQNGEYQNAKYDFDEVILMDIENWKAYYLRGLANMRLATSKYSRSNKNAIQDFTKSLSLNSTASNGKSYYYRGKVFQNIEDESYCSDYYQACEFNTLDACELVDEYCQPKTGFRPYDKIFGPGVFTGDREFTVTNNCDYDMVITLKGLRTRRSVRSEYVRSGEKLVMYRIPNGRYQVEYLQGFNWSFNKRLSDGISKGGFLIDQKTKSVNMIYNYNGYKMRGFENCVIGGDITSDEISEEQFFNQ